MVVFAGHTRLPRFAAILNLEFERIMSIKLMHPLDPDLAN